MPDLAALRAFAAEPGALFYVLQTAGGIVILWADDIRNADDASLLAMAGISPERLA